MGEVKLENISKSFGKTAIIENLNLTIKDGEFTVLVGASGCGKTTLLRIIAGIGPATSGKLYIDGEDVTDLPPGLRNVAMVFQNYAIYPTMTVKGNIEFGLVNMKVPKKKREQLINQVAETVGLTKYLNRKPNTLSGGQRQRVALARAMVKKPTVFLLDEPLSNLDAKLRATMRAELIELHKRLKTTFIYVTHDQTEAMSMADTIVVMDEGRIQQIGSPVEIYSNPSNLFTAQFIGSPPMNIIEKNEYRIGFRPEIVFFRPENGSDEDYIRYHGKIITREMLGSETIYKIQLMEGTSESSDCIITVKSIDWSKAEGEETDLYVKKNDFFFFDKYGLRIGDEKQKQLINKENRVATGTET